jgi:hypothetical protein
MVLVSNDVKNFGEHHKYGWGELSGNKVKTWSIVDQRCSNAGLADW